MILKKNTLKNYLLSSQTFKTTTDILSHAKKGKMYATKGTVVKLLYDKGVVAIVQKKDGTKFPCLKINLEQC